MRGKVTLPDVYEEFVQPELRVLGKLKEEKQFLNINTWYTYTVIPYFCLELIP